MDFEGNQPGLAGAWDESLSNDNRKNGRVYRASIRQQETIGQNDTLYSKRIGNSGRPVSSNPQLELERFVLFEFLNDSVQKSHGIQKILQREQPDLVEICDKYSFVYLGSCLRKGRMRGVRRPAAVGLTCERMDDNVKQFVHPGKFGERFSRCYMHRVYLPMFDFHIAISEYTAAELIAANEGRTMHRREVWVCPLGVDAARFRPSPHRKMLRRELISEVSGSTSTRLLLYAWNDVFRRAASP